MLEFSTSENPASMRSEWQGHIERGARRIEGLSHHPVHRYSVKTVWFDGMENLDMSARSFPQEQAFEIQQTLMSSYLLALKSFTNLRHVGLGSSVIVNDELAHALSNLPNMDELLMHGPCSTSIASPMIAVKALTLSDVPSRSQDGVSGLELCSSQRMTSLTLHGIRHPEILLCHELAQREVNFLTHIVLHVRTTQLTAVFYFLPSCRNLESIGLYPSSDNGHIPLKLPSLPADAMPRLSSFSGPVNLAHSIIPGRPVIDIEIVGLHQRDPSDFPYDWDVETLDNAILRPLVKSLVPIRRFHMALMPLSGTMLEVICQYFPQLHSLELGFDYRATNKIVMTDEDRQLMTFFGTNGCDPTHPISYLDENDTRDPDPLKASPIKLACVFNGHHLNVPCLPLYGYHTSAKLDIRSGPSQKKARWF
ncbi:hypothetical protein D9613_001357 [Agrocybe pediades]|uniref:Uncharacterized protein n=1 Tax=Agrocybe pediades TaxID=84607 RepID=A0A8H4VWP6_9AGAR|nr:hypothetical protein D9613_001357 [Agrocybe pediades]